MTVDLNQTVQILANRQFTGVAKGFHAIIRQQQIHVNDYLIQVKLQ